MDSFICCCLQNQHRSTSLQNLQTNGYIACVINNNIDKIQDGNGAI